MSGSEFKWRGFKSEFAQRLSLAVPAEASRALDVALTPDWVQARFDEEFGAHPVLGALVSELGLRNLAVLGTALAECSPRPGTAAHLQDPDRFEDLLFELMVGLFLVRTGASVMHEPTGNGITGPDWRAHWPTGETVDAEAKCLGISTAEQRARLIDSEQHRWLAFRLAPEGMQGRFHLEFDLDLKPTWDRALSLQTSEEEAVGVAREYYRAVRLAAQRVLREAAEPGKYDLAGLGVLRLKRAAPGPPGVAGMLTPMMADALDKTRVRIGRKLRDAEKQTSTAGNPGLLFIPAEPLLRSPFSFESSVAVALGRRQASEHPLDAVLIWNEEALFDQRQHVDQWFEVVDSPAGRGLPPALRQEALRSACGHLHYCPLPDDWVRRRLCTLA